MNRRALLQMAMGTVASLIAPKRALEAALLPERDVIIIAGQSNAIGRARVSDLTLEQKQMLRIPKHMKYYRWDEDRQLIKRTSFGSRGRFGVEVGLLPLLHPRQETIIIKCAVNGTSMLDWKPDWTPEEAQKTHKEYLGSLYRQMLKSVSQVTRNLSVSSWKLIWIQGERDCQFAYAANRYYENLVSLIQSLEKDLSADLRVRIVVVNDPQGDWGYPVIQSQINASSLPKVMAVSSYRVSKGHGGIHYDTPGILELSRRIVASW